MKKSNFFKATFILIIGGMVTKILGMVIRIITSRYLGSEGIGIYSLLMPTFSLLIALSSLGFPIAISKIVAENKSNNKNIIFSVIPISLFVNFSAFIFLFIFGKYISNNLLHESRTYYGLICMGLILPFISISSLLRGYFFGKENMLPHVISNIIEDIIRLIVLIIGIPIFLKKGLSYGVAFVIFSNLLSEIAAIVTLIIFLPKKTNISKKDLKPRKQNIKDVMSISIPTTSGRIIGNIGFFFEPIILTTTLLSMGFSSKYITNEYGIIAGFVLPVLLLPSFFTTAISQALIPVISKYYSNRKYKEAKQKLKQGIFLSLLIGIPCTIIFELYPDTLLHFLYNTNKGVNYLRFLAPICLLQYIQSPLASCLQAINKSKEAFYSSLIGTISKTLLLIVLTLKFGIWGFILATSFSMFIVTFIQLKYIKKSL